jgi:hypothetical protein
MVTHFNPFDKIRSGVDAVNYRISTAFVGLGCETGMMTIGLLKKETLTSPEGVNLWVLPDPKIRAI